MQTHQTVLALLSVAVLAAGCGGDELPVNAQSHAAPRGEVEQAPSSVEALACTWNGVSPELSAISGGPYQNCQGGTIPRTEYQSGTQPWSGCCGSLQRTCAVTGYSTLNTMTCTDKTCTSGGVSPQLAAIPGGPYQNCQGGIMPRVEYQSNTHAWSGCCGDLQRTCAVTGYSTLNTMICM
ncbi:uncharacterized protein STAUR_7689 [Stigmatella aurantiaca DW4/3-1]|uniref:Lipoprotein n=1 Tax=Stigmatella aurantiaca (strain DW4/3-1) TaxID=378806 RepID=E3FK75_STIAD|nr:uncharacterized protein STAUR_7689 [Stigmatella aurantiaca DW4/3-1]